MTTTDTTVPSWEAHSSISAANVPTTSSFNSFGCGLKSSITSAMALVALGFSSVAVEAPTNRLVEAKRYAQNESSDSLAKFASYQVDDEYSVSGYAYKYPVVTTFLEEIAPILKAAFGAALMELALWTSPVDEETHLYLTIHSGIQEEDVLADKEMALFDEIEENSLLRKGLAHVVIAIR